MKNLGTFALLLLLSLIWRESARASSPILHDNNQTMEVGSVQVAREEPKARLFGIDLVRGKVVEIDQRTGELADFASLPFEGFEELGLDYRPKDGKLYLIRRYENKISFYSIDITTGVVQLSDKVMTISPEFSVTPPSGISFTASGNVYGFGNDYRSDTVYLWFGDWNSGDFKLVPSVFRAESAFFNTAGGDFDDRSQVYLIYEPQWYNSSDWSGELYQLNPSTGGCSQWISLGDRISIEDIDVMPGGEVVMVVIQPPKTRQC